MSESILNTRPRGNTTFGQIQDSQVVETFQRALNRLVEEDEGIVRQMKFLEVA